MPLIIVITNYYRLARSRKSTIFSALTASDFNPTPTIRSSPVIIKSINERSARETITTRLPHYLSVAPINDHDSCQFLHPNRYVCVNVAGWETINLLKSFCLSACSGNCTLKVEDEPQVLELSYITE